MGRTGVRLRCRLPEFFFRPQQRCLSPPRVCFLLFRPVPAPGVSSRRYATRQPCCYVAQQHAALHMHAPPNTCSGGERLTPAEGEVYSIASAQKLRLKCAAARRATRNRAAMQRKAEKAPGAGAARENAATAREQQQHAAVRHSATQLKCTGAGAAGRSTPVRQQQ